jgi:hypothetical protein
VRKQDNDERERPVPGRILARVLAEELRYATGGGEPTMVTDPGPNGRKDITNVSDDTPSV